MATRDVIVIGASAGGVEALRTLVSRFPPDLPATVLVVMHLPQGGFSALPAILNRCGPLPASPAADGDKLEPGRIFVAPVDAHLMVVDGHLHLARGPKENGHRPAVDVLFRSAAAALGPRVIGVVLSGSLDDGTAGLAAVTARGGVAVVQDPDDALYVGMPLNALTHVDVEHVVPVSVMAGLLDRLSRVEVDPDGAPPPSELMVVEAGVAAMEPEAVSEPGRPGRPSGLGCPNCHGSLFEIREAGVVRYRCRVGHAWSSQSLLVEQASALETALWMALRALDDKAALCRRLAGPARERGRHLSAERYAQQVAEAERAAGVIREFLASGIGHGPAGEDEAAGSGG